MTPSSQSQTIRPLIEQQIALGTYTQFTQAGEGAYWHSQWGVGIASSLANLSYNKNQLYAYALQIGGGSAGAWTGRRFDITGNGYQYAYVDFYGAAHSQSTPSLSGGTNWQVDAIIYDATTSTIIGQTTIFSASHGVSLLTYTDGGSIGNSILVAFQANHEYVIELQTTGDCSQYGLFATTMDSYNSNYVTTWSSIDLRWI